MWTLHRDIKVEFRFASHVMFGMLRSCLIYSLYLLSSESCMRYVCPGPSLASAFGTLPVKIWRPKLDRAASQGFLSLYPHLYVNLFPSFIYTVHSELSLPAPAYEHILSLKSHE